MKKKYVKPELVNILTVGGGKPNNRLAERMGTKRQFTMGHSKYSNMQPYLMETVRNTNILHTSLSIKNHIYTEKQVVYGAKVNTTIIRTKTVAASDEGPS